MPSYSFYIYNTKYFGYNSATQNFDFEGNFQNSDGIYRIEVSDDDSFMDSSGDANQLATVYALNGTVVASGQIDSPFYAELSPGPEYIDRIEIDGVLMGYYPSAELTPGNSYPVTGSNTGGMNHSYFSANNLPCFGPGAQVRTPTGYRPITALSVGDAVLTRDHGPQPIKWIGQAEVSVAEQEHAAMRPLMLAPEHFGSASGHAPLALSGNHRVLLQGPWAELLFAAPEVFVAAGFLREHPGVQTRPATCSIAYSHLLFDRHEVIEANGIWVESLLAGPVALSSLPPLLRRRVGLLGGEMTPARPCLSRADARLLCRLSQPRQVA